MTIEKTAVPWHYLWVVLIVAISFISGGVSAYCEREHDFRREAIEAGVAEYRCDPKTGKIEFAWVKSKNSLDSPPAEP